MITTLIEKTGKPVVNDKVDRFGPEAQLLSLLQCIGEDWRNIQRLNPSFDVQAKYCETGALLRDFNLLLLNCYRRFEVMSDISKTVNSAN